MEDHYTPDDPALAQCPHCRFEADGAPTAAAATLVFATLKWTCPRCHGGWNEVRFDGTVTRLWTAAPA